MKSVKAIPIILLVLVLLSGCQKPKVVQSEIDWPGFMANQDLIWDELPLRWEMPPSMEMVW